MSGIYHPENNEFKTETVLEHFLYVPAKQGELYEIKTICRCRYTYGYATN